MNAVLDMAPARAGPGGAASTRRLTQIVVVVPSDRARGWAVRLAEALESRFGLPVRMLRAPWAGRSRPAMPSELLEQRLFAAAVHAEWAPTDGLDSVEAVSWAQALVVNATERDPRAFPPQAREGVILSPTFHGGCALDGLARVLFRGEPLHLGVRLSTPQGSVLLQGARLAPPERAGVRRALQLVLGRMITLMLGAVEHVLTGRPLAEPSPPPAAQAQLTGLDFWRRYALAGAPRLGRWLGKPLVRHGWWCVGVRRLRGECAPHDLDLDAGAFRILDPGPDRFFADPFLLRHAGLTALFFEDYAYGLDRAWISCLLLDEAGRPGAPVPVLSRPYHLSYPFVFVHQGVPLMIPETSGNRTIELYEARRFPDEWRLRAVLMEDVNASDTTLHFDSRTGLWWMFTTLSEFDSSTHDTLSLFYSRRPEGPWRAHAGNPVKLDPASSRPAGPLLPWNGRLFRPAQDCTRTYGGGLVWCEVEALGPDVFREATVARQAPGRGFSGLHTYGRAAGFEVVDFKRDRSRLRAGRDRPAPEPWPEPDVAEAAGDGPLNAPSPEP